MTTLYVVPKQHKDAVVAIGVGVDELATARHEIPDTGVIIEHGDDLLCFVNETEHDPRDALRAIAALVRQEFDNPVLDPFRAVIKADPANGAEGIAVDCEAIAEAALT